MARGWEARPRWRCLSPVGKEDGSTIPSRPPPSSACRRGSTKASQPGAVFLAALVLPLATVPSPAPVPIGRRRAAPGHRRIANFPGSAWGFGLPMINLGRRSTSRLISYGPYGCLHNQWWVAFAPHWAEQLLSRGVRPVSSLFACRASEE